MPQCSEEGCENSNDSENEVPLIKAFIGKSARWFCLDCLLKKA
jgi:hypothetical protein